MLKIGDKVRYGDLNEIGKIIAITNIMKNNICFVKYGLFKKMWCFEDSLEKVGE